MKNPEIYNVRSSSVLSILTGDKIMLGMGMIFLLSIVGAVIDNNYSVKLDGDSIDLHR